MLTSTKTENFLTSEFVFTHTENIKNGLYDKK